VRAGLKLALTAAQEQVIGAQVFRRARGAAAQVGCLDRGFDAGGHRVGYLVLQGEDVLQRTVEPVGPKLLAVGRLDQGDRDADLWPRATHGALQEVPDAELAADPGHVALSPPVA